MVEGCSADFIIGSDRLVSAKSCHRLSAKLVQFQSISMKSFLNCRLNMSFPEFHERATGDVEH